MAYILDRSKTTLRQMLGRYHSLVLGVAILMSLGAIVFCMISTQSYSKAMEQVLSLNEYYVQFDETDADLNSYILNGGVSVGEKLNQDIIKLQELMRKLERLFVSLDFQRDIGDVSYMTEKYKEKVEEISGKVWEGQGEWPSAVYGDILSLYDEAKDIYERINSEFKPLHLQLLTFTSMRQEKFMQKSIVYYAVFLAMMMLLGVGGAMRGKRLSSWIVSPIQTLTRGAEEIRDGKLFEFQEIRFQKSMYNEIEILTNVFNMMAQQIKAQIRIIEEDAKTKVALQKNEVERLRIKNLLQTSELKALQMQMNPHFLFNTLNMIAKTAHIEDAGKTVFLIQKAAQLLRYSLDYMGKSVTLASEMECLGNYVYLQEHRFGKRIQFIFELDERFHKIEIPCLILQPLVENSIIHGVGVFVEGGIIKIQTSYVQETGCVTICISDNGRGIEEGLLEQIRKNLFSDKEQREKIGLANVFRRLYIFFGDRMKFEIMSKRQKGTQIRITIPAEKERKEEVHVEDAYRGR